MKCSKCVTSIAGAIFSVHDHESIIAFHSAIHKENTYERRFELRPILRNVTEFDSFVTEKIGAEIKLTSPVRRWGLFLPPSGPLIRFHVQSAIRMLHLSLALFE